MNPLAFIGDLDDRCLVWLNGFMGRWPMFDRNLRHLLGNHELKFGVLVAIFCWLWFRSSKDVQRDRRILITTALASLGSLILTRLLVLLLPFRERPFLRPDLHFVLPPGFESDLRTWSAFPSDHAVMAFALATGFWMISRRLGALAFVHALLCICAPRIYFGLHHPSDIVVGALIGVLSVVLSVRATRAGAFIARLLQQEQRHSAMFYVIFFLFLQQTVVMFNGIRPVVAAAFSMLTRGCLVASSG